MVDDNPEDGTSGGNRTHTLVKEADFESAALTIQEKKSPVPSKVAGDADMLFVFTDQAIRRGVFIFLTILNSPLVSLRQCLR